MKFKDFPEDILSYIFEFILDKNELITLRGVNRNWNRTAVRRFASKYALIQREESYIELTRVMALIFPIRFRLVILHPDTRFHFIPQHCSSVSYEKENPDVITISTDLEQVSL